MKNGPEYARVCKGSNLRSPRRQDSRQPPSLTLFLSYITDAGGFRNTPAGTSSRNNFPLFRSDVDYLRPRDREEKEQWTNIPAYRAQAFGFMLSVKDLEM